MQFINALTRGKIKRCGVVRAMNWYEFFGEVFVCETYAMRAIIKLICPLQISDGLYMHCERCDDGG